MSDTLTPRNYFGRSVSPQHIDEAELENKTLQAGEETTVWSTQVPADKAFVWGFGPDNRNAGNSNYIYAEFLASGNGDGADGDVIRDADVVVAVTDSTREDTLGKRTLGPTAGNLADAKADDPTERPILPELYKGASEDRHLELRLRARSGADGIEVANDSDIDLGYGRVG